MAEPDIAVAGPDVAIGGGRTSRWRRRTSRRPAPALRVAGRGADGSQACSALLACGTHPIADTDFVVVDLETTGWSPDTARITEIGAVRFTGGRVTGEFCTLINPGQAIPADIAALTGISDAMVARAPVIGAVLPDFLAFAGGAVLAAHNAPFDVSFLVAACGDCGLPWPDLAVLDTVTLARQVLGETEVPDCKLSTLASYLPDADGAESSRPGRRAGYRRGAARPDRAAGRVRRAHAGRDIRLSDRTSARPRRCLPRSMYGCRRTGGGKVPSTTPEPSGWPAGRPGWSRY